METRCISLLEHLKAYRDEIYDFTDPSDITEPDKLIPEDVAAIAGVKMTPECSRLFKELEAIAKTSKEISQEYPIEILDESDIISTGEDKTAESLPETPPPSERPEEENASTGEDKTTESLPETPPPSERPEEENASTGEDKSPESQENFQLAERLVETSKERETFRVLMDVSNFLPKELYVKILGKYLVVHGEHETVFDEHGKISRKFTRKFEIPENVDAETFRALLDSYRVLIIEASLKSMNDKDEDFDVPIYEEPYSESIFSPFKSLGPEFEELMQSHIKDGQFMRDFVRNLAKQSPSDYIPIEAVI